MDKNGYTVEWQMPSRFQGELSGAEAGEVPEKGDTHIERVIADTRKHFDLG